jgi:hypothetical protein
VVIFDWDDTLLPSSWLSIKGLRLDDMSDFSVEVAFHLDSLEEIACKVLGKALEVADVIIITNAETGWVELSSQRFMPRVSEYLKRVKVVSARTTYEYLFPESPLDWKLQAFSHEIERKLTTAAHSQKRNNVISFGDSVHERNALHHVCKGRDNTLTKSVKFVERPTADQLRREIELIHNSFDYIHTHNGDLDLMLTIQLLSN